MLGPALAKRGLALENQGDIDRQAIAGATATATHGTGLRFPNISARVVGMRLVTVSGDVVDLTQESDPEGLHAARVSLGSLGIASTVTLQCVPLYTLHRHDQPLPLHDTLERLDEHVEDSDHFEFSYVSVHPDRLDALDSALQRRPQADARVAPSP